ncbi:MAG TPA: hypothetical protein VNE63_22175 [Candidatus Acidoferrales bacterium]|nr:hypothetical protein [Candidatus Acidoferrales bacterium]
MGLYNFQPHFVPFILSGEKTHTIRAMRVHPDKPGDVLHLYTGLRHKGARLLMRVPCVKIEEIRIHGDDRTMPWDPFQIAINGIELGLDECEALARRDGFPDYHEMMKFWGGRLPFHGHIIHWRYA